jgi:phage terminase large subunit
MNDSPNLEEDFEFPEALSFLLFESARYKVLYGGRGAGKTENIARGLIMLCRTRKLRVACFRELQSSIGESVYATLVNCLSDMNIEDEFDIQKTTVVCKRTGSEFIFSGLRYNINKIKSMARIDIAWVEEAVNVSRISWAKLGPTIRGRHKDDPNGMGGPFGLGPEIWISFNPELDTDETYRRFVLKKDQYAPDFIKDEDTGEEIRYAIVKKVNYTDNKWFPADQKYEMEVCKAGNEDEYLYIWEGNTKQVLEGSIYAKELQQVLKDGRRGNVRYDPSRPVHTFWDLGHGDKTAIWFIQTVGMEFNVINYYENRLEKMPHYIGILQDLKYNYGIHNLPHDGDAETLSNVTPKKQLQAAGYRVRIIKRPSRKFVGINAARSVFPLCNFDEENTADGWQCLARYCYKVDEDKPGVFSNEPEHDTPWSHGADGWQTFALSLKSEIASKKPEKEKPVIHSVKMLSKGNAWMGG